MADDPIPSPSPPRDSTEAPPPPRRKVYQPTLFPERRHRRVSPWLVVPVVLLLCGGILYWLFMAQHRTRFVATAGEVVYASDQGTPGIPHLWAAGFDGSGAHRLTHITAVETAPAFAPGGSRVAFLSDRDGHQNQVFVMDADGQGLAQVTRGGGAKSQPSWAAGDQGLLGFTSGGVLSMLSVSPDGAGSAGRLLPPPPQAPQAAGAEGTTPEETLAQQTTITVPAYAWSPSKEGGLAAVEDTGSFQALAVFSSVPGTAKDVQTTAQGTTPIAAADALSLGWSPDGSLLAVAMLNIKGLASASGILLFDHDGSPVGGQSPALGHSVTVGPQNPVFSPDGTDLLFELWSQPDLAHRRRLGLYLVPVNGSGPPHLLYKGDASQARWTPDGTTVLFLAGRADGGHDLCRVAADGSGFRRLSDGQADISGLTVSPQRSH